jgi:hypothetical protein
MQQQATSLDRISKRIDRGLAELDAIGTAIDAAMAGDKDGIVDVSDEFMDDVNRRLRNIGRRRERLQLALDALG